MILATKITQLRKQAGWSQEELAHKMDISRQSVSKWESANSIPDLNKIITLAQIFEVSTDFLLKDEIETQETTSEHKETHLTQISLEQATAYVNSKMQKTALTIKGVLFCVCSVIPMFFFLAMAQTNRMGLTENVAGAIGVVVILIMLAMGVSYLIKLNQFDEATHHMDDEKFELAYGVHSVFQEKLKHFRPTYNFRLSAGIFMFITCFAPLMLVAVFFQNSELEILMLIVLIVMVAIGLAIVIPVSAKFDAYNHILKDHTQETEKSKRVKRTQKLAAFYWPMLTAIYLGWSLWSMDWNITWIVWPVGSVLFIALVGLMELLEKDEDGV